MAFSALSMISKHLVFAADELKIAWEIKVQIDGNNSSIMMKFGRHKDGSFGLEHAYVHVYIFIIQQIGSNPS